VFELLGQTRHVRHPNILERHDGGGAVRQDARDAVGCGSQVESYARGGMRGRRLSSACADTEWLSAQRDVA
jgi:hypothetical protein